MTNESILIFSTLLLLAFGIERFGKSTGLPSVVVLIAIGIFSKIATTALNIEISSIDAAVPVLGTVGLVLIVLEGAFDLKLKRECMSVGLKALSSAILGLAASSLAITFFFAWLIELSVYQAFLLALPFSVISSAVAIPSSSFLPQQGREFVIYESSISDIVGILFFFAALNSDGTFSNILSTLLSSGLASTFLGGICAIALLIALFRLDGHIRFIPLLAGLFALYSIGKLIHLSPLIMVLIFGLIINNLRLFSGIPRLKQITVDVDFADTIKEFKSITAELTFAVRSIFFVLLGFWTDWNSIGHPTAWLIAAGLLLAIYISRFAILKSLRTPHTAALTWLAPRGLITVLLYFAAKPIINPPEYIDGALMLMVLLTSIVISIGRLRT